MPITPTYPGVYIDELPSAVRTIVGVPTSVAAFVGWAPRGPSDPVRISGWADYEHSFGGLHPDSPLSYAVFQFYQNGGVDAEIVRLAPHDAAPAMLHLPSGDPKDTTVGPNLQAVSAGEWGNKLRVRVDHNTRAEVPAESGGQPPRTLYNLTIRDTETGVEEHYLNVSTDRKGSQGLANSLRSSRLMRLADQNPNDDKLPNSGADVDYGTDPFDDSEPDRYVQAGGGANGSPTLSAADYLGGQGDTFQQDKKGLFELIKTDIFNVLCLPGVRSDDGNGGDVILPQASRLCVDRRAMLIVDPPNGWNTVQTTATEAVNLPLQGDSARNAAIYFPDVRVPDQLLNGTPRTFPPCGVVAGVWARTDAQRGVWKAPAGTDASLNGVTDLATALNDLDNGLLNPLGVNCLRTLPSVGPVSWGARTMLGADVLASQWKYVPVRRLALFIEESLFRGTKWVVFEPNDEPLWSSIRLNVGAFMNNLFRQGAFQGRTPQEAYLVQCDARNNPQNDIDRGIVNILVGFAPLKPAEFVLVHIQQLAGQIQV